MNTTRLLPNSVILYIEESYLQKGKQKNYKRIKPPKQSETLYPVRNLLPKFTIHSAHMQKNIIPKSIPPAIKSRIDVLKHLCIALFPNMPASYETNLQETLPSKPQSGQDKHLKELQRCIPRNSNFPPTPFTKGALKKQMK
jgi:hypothetical protein